MKKVKLMLASIAMLAVIGGVFAFKAKSAFHSTLYTTTTGANLLAATACDIENQNVKTTTLEPGTQPLVYYTVANASGPCFTKTSFYTTTVE